MLTLDPPVHEATSNVVTRAGKAFWQFLGSFLSFVGVIIVSMLLSSSEYQEALYDRAEELDVNQNFLPASELAEIVRTYPDPLVTYLVTAALFLLSAVLFASGLRLLGDISGRVTLTRAALTLAVLGGVCMAVMTFLPRLLADGSVWLLENWWVYMTLVGIAVIAACRSHAHGGGDAGERPRTPNRHRGGRVVRSDHRRAADRDRTSHRSDPSGRSLRL